MLQPSRQIEHMKNAGSSLTAQFNEKHSLRQFSGPVTRLDARPNSVQVGCQCSPDRFGHRLDLVPVLVVIDTYSQ